MPRWIEDAPGRLQRAALELFLERGYEKVTVAEIAERAGLTRRSFFNHFSDKREVFFAGAAAFQTGVIDQVEAAPSSQHPFDVAIAALTTAGSELAELAGDWAQPVRSIIATSAELRERELTKMAALADAVADALTHRGAAPREAEFMARAAVAVFAVAYDDSIDTPGQDLAVLMRDAVTDLRTALL